MAIPATIKETMPNKTQHILKHNLETTIKFCFRTLFRYFTMYSSLFIYWVYTEFYLSHITSQHIKYREKVEKNLRDLPIRAIFPTWNKFLMSFLFLYTALMESQAYSSRWTTHRGQEPILIQHYTPRTKNGIDHKLNA